MLASFEKHYKLSFLDGPVLSRMCEFNPDSEITGQETFLYLSFPICKTGVTIATSNSPKA